MMEMLKDPRHNSPEGIHNTLTGHSLFSQFETSKPATKALTFIAVPGYLFHSSHCLSLLIHLEV